MAKKKKNPKKEDLLKMLNEMADSDDITPEDKEKLKELSLEIDSIKIYSKFTYILGYAIVYLFKIILMYIISLVVLGLFVNFMVIDKIYVFLIPLGVSLIFNAVSLAANVILDIKKTFNVVILSYLFIVMVFLIINIYFKVFEFGTIWLFYLFLVNIIDEYIMYKIIRRKLWTEKY